MNISEKLLDTIKWTSRIFCIIFILFISMFALDVFQEGAGFWRTAGGLFIHLLPSFIMTGVLIISWKRPWVGGVVFLIIAVSYLFLTTGRKTYPVISIPLFLISALFILHCILVRDVFRGNKRL